MSPETLRSKIADLVPKSSTETLRSKVASLMPQAKADLTALVACRSVADLKQQPKEQCDLAADWIVNAFTEVGLQDMTRATTPDGSDCVHGHAPGPDGSPTVLLYSHYDVQPPLGADSWRTPVWDLTVGDDGRWYGRGTADCKGNVIAHLTALRALKALDGSFPVGIKLLIEGSEEQGTDGLGRYVPDNADLLRSDTICMVDTGNAAVGQPTLTTSLRGITSVDIKLDALDNAMHSGMFGGAAPDPVAALIRILASLHDADGNSTVDGLQNTGEWSGAEYPAAQFRTDAHVLDGVSLIGSGSVADMVWARFDVTTLGIDIPSVDACAPAIQASARARVSLRMPPGTAVADARHALKEHLRSRVPWGLHCTIEDRESGEAFVGTLAGPGYDALKAGLEESYGKPLATEGQGGAIPLCNVLHATFPDAEIMLYGVEEPRCLIHAPNESVAPSEIEHIALAEALFLRKYGAASS
jgi:acetylornithine deacetylase/succinyl-diaminopimelate desuccinylase-like protein